MLIVVAIIAILVAVSIPIAATALERTRVATDAANERAAKAEAVITYLSSNNTVVDFAGAGKQYAYDAANGTLVDSAKTDEITSIKPYGKCTKKHNSGSGTEQVGPHNNNILWVLIKADGTVTLKWSTTTAAGEWTRKTTHNAFVED